MGKGKKDGNSFKMEKSFNAIPTLSKTPTYLSPVCGLWKDISGLGSRGENLPSEGGLGMSYRLLRGWKSLGPDHGFSIQLQPRPGSREEASPPALVKGWNIEVNVMVAPILRTESFVFGSRMFGEREAADQSANSAESPTGSLICSCLSTTCLKAVLGEQHISKYALIYFKIRLWKLQQQLQ